MNAHFNVKPNVLSPNLMESYRQKCLFYPVFFEQLPQITLSKSCYQVTSFVDLSPYQNMFHKIGQYIITLKYEVLQYQRVHNFSPYPNPERDTLYQDMIQDILNEIYILVETLKCIMQHYNKILKTIQPNIVLNLTQPTRTKCGIITKVFNWLFGGNDNSDTIRQLKSYVEILYNNDKLHSDQIQELCGLNNLTWYEVHTNRKLLQKLDHNIKVLEVKLFNLQKEVQTLISDRNFFITVTVTGNA